MEQGEPTRVDKAITRLKNNKIIAPLVVVAICFLAIASVWEKLPEGLRNSVGALISPAKLNSGWIFVGYQNSSNQVYWDEGPYASIVGTAPSDPRVPFRPGNVIRLNHDRELVIVDYKKSGTKEFYASPPSVHGILEPDDHTGSILKAGTELLVRDVWIGSFPGSDYAVWLRVTPSNTAD